MEHKILLELTEISNLFLAKPWFFSQTSIILFHIFHGVSFVVLNYMFRLQRRSEHNAVIRRYSCVCVESKPFEITFVLAAGACCRSFGSTNGEWLPISFVMILAVVDAGCLECLEVWDTLFRFWNGGCFEKLMFWDAWTPGKKKHLFMSCFRRLLEVGLQKSLQATAGPLGPSYSPQKLKIDVQS